jgi:hypothetical protein
MIDFLAKVSFLGRAVSFVTSKTRLVLEYTLIGLVISSTALAIALWYRANALEEKNAALDRAIAAAQSVDAAQTATIAELHNLRERDAKAISGLVADYRVLATSNENAKRKLAELEKRNEAVRVYLATPIPPDLACVLNDTCAPKSGGAARKSSAAK